MNDRAQPRRPGFDDIVNGWSYDAKAEDLKARIELAREHVTKSFPAEPSLAENRILTAMEARLRHMRVPAE